MNINSLLTKFAAARTKQAEDPWPWWSTQGIFGDDPLSGTSIDPTTGQLVVTTSTIPAMLAGAAVGSNLPGIGKAINRGVEASRYFQSPIYRPVDLNTNPATAPLRLRNPIPSLADMEYNRHQFDVPIFTRNFDPNTTTMRPRTEPSTFARAFGNAFPAATLGPDDSLRQFRIYDAPPPGSGITGQTQIPIGPLMNRGDMYDSGLLNFLTQTNANDINIPGRIAQFENLPPAQPAQPNTSPTGPREISSIPRRAFYQFSRRPAINALFGSNPNLNTYVNPTTPSVFTPPMTTEQSGLTGTQTSRLNPDYVRRGIGEAANLLKWVPNSVKAKTGLGAAGAVVAPYFANWVQGTPGWNFTVNRTPVEGPSNRLQ
jgi:hypothetical protein